jgi:hypothetical protein
MEYDKVIRYSYIISIILVVINGIIFFTCFFLTNTVYVEFFISMISIIGIAILIETPELVRTYISR